MKLSILIPTLPEPDSQAYLRRLNKILDPQIEKYNWAVEKLIHDAGRSMPTGTKRNELIMHSRGEYFSQIDCDDIIPPYYVDELLNGIIKNVDVVSFVGYMTTNGKDRRDFTIKVGSEYEERDGHYYRFPNHLCCFKREKVEHIKFPSIWIQEDYFWAKSVRDSGILKTELHIDKWMYHYDFKTKANARRAR